MVSSLLLAEVEVPVGVEVATASQAAKLQHRFGTLQAPTRARAEHTRIVEASSVCA